MANDYGNVPGQPQYGDVKDIEAQEASAPMPQGEAPAPAPAPMAEPAPQEAAPMAGPRPDNIVSVLPPEETSPMNTGAVPMSPEVNLAYIILGTSGMGSMARSFASQVVGSYPMESEAAIAEQELPPEDLQAYQDEQLVAEMGV